MKTLSLFGGNFES